MRTVQILQPVFVSYFDMVDLLRSAFVRVGAWLGRHLEISISLV